MLKIALCDDEEIHRLLIYDKLERFSIVHNVELVVEQFSTSNELMHMSNDYDILLLDIRLENGVNGIEVAKNIIDNGITAIIIIITSLEQYAIEGYKIDVHRYLLKPIKQEDLDEALLSCINKMESSEKRIEVKCFYENYIFIIDNISCIESYQRKRKLFVNDKVYETSITLQRFMSLLPTNQFCMPQKSYIINFKHIQSITQTKILLDNGIHINIARDRATQFNKSFHEYMGMKL